MPDADKIKGAAGDLQSSLEQKKRALEAAKEQAEAPFKIMKAKQAQAKAIADAAKKKADAASRIMELKELAHMREKGSAGRTIGGLKSQADSIKDSVASRQRDYEMNADKVRKLIEKIEAGIKK